MQTITKYFIVFIISLGLQYANAQEQATASESIEMLIKLKNTIEEEEREQLKEKVEAINQRFDKGEISRNEANRLKKEAAKNML